MSTDEMKMDVRQMKSGGFIKQPEKDTFVARIHVYGGNIEADKLLKAAELSRKYGRGYLHLTFQQSLEITGLDVSRVSEFYKDLDAAGLTMANCGPKIRAMTACQGCKVNPYGVVDAPGLAAQADKMFFGREMPAKFKVAYSGCPIGCPNPQENDIGFHGMVEPELDAGLCNGCTLCARLCTSRGGDCLVMDEKTNLPVRDDSKCVYCGECIYCCPTLAMKTKRAGHAVYVGGKHGRFPRWANRVADFVSDEDTFELIEKVSTWYKTNAKRGERLGTAIDRLGLNKFRKEVLGDKYKTAHKWDREGSRPEGVKYRVLHTWDSE